VVGTPDDRRLLGRQLAADRLEAVAEVGAGQALGQVVAHVALGVGCIFGLLLFVLEEVEEEADDVR
jgi:hypothetical protein